MNENQNMNMNSTPMTNGMPPMSPQKSSRKMGMTLLVLVIILLIIIGAIYFLGSNKGSEEIILPITTENAQSPDVMRNEAGLPENVDAEIESDLDAQLQDIEYSF